MKMGLELMRWKVVIKTYSSSESAHSIGFVRGYHGINKCRQNSLQSSKRRRDTKTEKPIVALGRR